MIQLTANQNGELKLHNGNTKKIQYAYMYAANRYVLSLDRTTATIYFDEGVAENVQVDLFDMDTKLAEVEEINTSKSIFIKKKDVTDTTKSES